MKRLAVLFTFLLLTVSASAWAEVKPGTMTLSPLIGGYGFEGNQKNDAGFVIGAGAGYTLTEHLGAELFFGYINSDNDAHKGNVNGYLYKLDGLYYFTNFGKLVPYAAAGLGGLTLDYSRDKAHSSFILNYGAGVQYFVTENVALRGDIRHIIALGEENNNIMGTAGVTFYFGGKKPAPAPAPAPKVEAPPAPAPPAPAPKAEAKVEPAPAPAPEPDSDGDGVPDSRDKCPDTPKGVAVDKDGCPLPIKTEQAYEIKVEFDFDKDFVRPRYHDELKNIAGIIKQYPENKAVIEGHTDSKGNDSYNMKLSQRRADSVRKYLIDNFGVNPNQLSAKGYGETRPIATNDTDEGRQRNRRVELHLTTIKMQKP